MKRLLAVCTLLFFSFLAFEVNAQLGSNTRTLKADVIDSNTTSLIEFLKDIKLSSTGYVLLPKGTTAQRPSTPLAGMFRYNTEENTFEGYTDEWGPIAGGGGLSQWSANTEFEANQVVFLEDNNIYKIYAAKALFISGATFNKSNWDELSKSRADQKELLLDGSFEYGVFEWSCTDATVTQAAGGVSGDFQAQIDFTADGGFCELVSVVSGDTANQEYLPRAYVKTSNATVKLELLDGTRVVAEPEVLADGSYLSYAAQVIPSTSIITRVTGNNTDQAFVDAAGHTLGGFNGAASKNCSGVLDCVNKLTVNVENSGSITVGDRSPDIVWWDSITRNSTGNVTIDYTSLGLVDTPSISISGDLLTTDGNIEYRSLTNTSAQIITADGNVSSDKNFSFTLFKQGTDYKTTEDKGVVTIPSNKDARLVVTNEGTTSNQTVGNATVTVAFDTVKPISQLIDFASNEATFQKSGEYRLVSEAVIFNSGENANYYYYPEINKGAGYAPLPEDSSECSSTTSANEARSADTTCNFLIKASKGDKVRLRLRSTGASAVIVNSNDRYPRMIITPLGGRQNIGEFATHRLLGEERRTSDTIGGEPIYEYCNEVATDISSDTTIESNPVGKNLRVIGANKYTSDAFALQVSATVNNFSMISYVPSSGNITVNFNSHILGAGTVYCMRYRKP